jgi:hypothetical protein
VGLKICLIKEPEFAIDFERYRYAQPVVAAQASNRSMAQVGREAIILIGQIFKALGWASYDTFYASWSLFKYTVLGCYGPLAFKRCQISLNIYLVVFRVVLWVGRLGLCLINKTIEHLASFRSIQISQSRDHLLQHCLNAVGNKEIDLAHMQAEEEVIDVSHVPSNLTIDHMRLMLGEINIDRPADPGYVAPKDEENRSYTKKELEDGLDRFLQHVTGRVAILGFPPAHNLDALNACCEKIENRIRFCIDKVNRQFDAFQKKHNDPSKYDEAATNTYKSLLEDKARIVLACAIPGAAKRCGTRYRQETRTLYQEFSSGAIVYDTLQAQLFGILAEERAQIAKEEALIHFGKNVHGESSYVSNFGKILALPDAEEDHLSYSGNQEVCLISFFKKYTVNRMIDAVQRACKTSQSFRTKINDWLKDQRGNWAPDGVQIEEVNPSWNAILNQNAVSEGFAGLKNLEMLKDFVLHLKENQIELPDINEPSWDDFWCKLCALECVKDYLALNPPPPPLSHRMKRVSTLIKYLKEINVGIPEMSEDEDSIDYWARLFAIPKAEQWLITHPEEAVPKQQICHQKSAGMRALFDESQLGDQLREAVKSALLANGQLAIGDFLPRLLEVEKVDKLVLQSGIAPEVALRVVEGKKSLDEAYREDQERQLLTGVFIQQLGVHAKVEGGLTKEMMEWLLVSQRALLVQDEEDV